MSSTNTYYEHKVKLKEYMQNSFYLNNDNTKSEKNKNNKKRLQEQKKCFYKNLLEEQKDIKIKFGKNRSKNMSEEDKQKLKE